MPLPRLCRECLSKGLLTGFKSWVRGIGCRPSLHSGRVINQLFTLSSTIERLRQGPLNEYLDAYATDVAAQGYGSHSIRQQRTAREMRDTVTIAALTMASEF